MDHDGNLRHLVYNMERVLADPPPRAPLSDQIRPQAVHSMDEENGISKMVVVLDCHNYRHIASAPSAPNNCERGRIPRRSSMLPS